MKKVMLVMVALILLPIASVSPTEAKPKAQVNKIKSYNPAQRKKLFEWALKECSKQYGGIGANAPDINYVTGQIWCRG